MPEQKIVATLDETKVGALGERILDEVNAGMSCLNLYVGHRLGLFRALQGAGDVTPADLTALTGYDERYLREWLECMAVNGYIDHEAETDSFSLPPEHAAVLADDEHPGYASPFVCWIPSLASVVPQLMDAFSSGGSVPYEDYGVDTLEAVGTGNKAMFVNDYATKWLHAMPDVESRLKAGGRVADIGCGVGWSSICLAQAFPVVTVHAVDLDPESISLARANAKAAGVADRISFQAADAEEAPLEGPYDLITAFECIHDMAHPVAALKRMHGLVADDGAVLVAPGHRPGVTLASPSTDHTERCAVCRPARDVSTDSGDVPGRPARALGSPGPRSTPRSCSAGLASFRRLRLIHSMCLPCSETVSWNGLCH